jgi:hypothetical protein
MGVNLITASRRAYAGCRAAFHHDGMDSSRFPMRHHVPHQLIAHQRNQEETEMDATTVAVDLAKTVFQVVIADRQAHIVSRHR